MILHFNPTNYQRIENPRRIDTSASGASFATSTGDIVEASAYGPGVFRIRIGPNARPDYGIVVAKAKPCEVTQRSDDVTTLTSGEAMLELSGGPLRFRLSWEGQVVVESITDQHVRGFTRLPAFGRIREGGEWTAGIALTSGEPVYGLGEKFGPLDKRGQLVHSQVDGALGVNIGLSYKNTPFAWSPGGRRGAWGVFAHTPGRVAHGVGHPDWSHRTYALVVDDEALDLFLFAAKTPADILALYTDLTGRAPAVPRWSLGLWVSRAYYKTPEEAIEVAKQLRERRIPCDVITLDGRAAWDTRTRFDFRWDPARLADAKASLAALHAQNLRVCVWEYPLVSIHGRLFAELFARDFLLTTTQGDPYVMSWDTSSATSPSGNVATLPPESGIVDFTNPQAYAWWRDAHRTLFEEGVDVITSDFGEQVPDDAVASNGDDGRRLHNVYPLLYNRCVFEATRKYGREENGPPMVWSRAAWSGQQRYPMGWGGDPQSDWEGLAASIRGGLSWGMSGNPFHSSDIGGSYGAEQPSAELFLRWLQATVFNSHIRVHGVGEREPWAFGEEIEAIARKWLAFRYRLIPYLEHVIEIATQTGLPVMRALPLAFPANALTRRYETQFMCGDALLIAPILREGGEVEVALPPGGWYDLNSRARYPGRQVMRYKAALDQFPVFGREGYVLPLGRSVQHTGEIDSAKSIEQAWVFGKPTTPLELKELQVITNDGRDATLRARAHVEVHCFGEPVAIERL